MVALLIGAATAPAGCAERPPEYTVRAAEIGDVRDVVTAVGTVRPLVQVEVRPEISGQVTAVLVGPNEQVRAGQVLARLRPDRLGLSVEEARAEMAAARAGLAEADTRARQAERVLRNRRTLVEKGLISEAAVGNDHANAETAAAALRRAQAEFSRTEVRTRTASAALQDVVIRAPIDGFVLSRTAEVGQLATSSSEAPLFVVASNSGQMLVEARVAEPDIGRVAQSVRIAFSVEAYPGEVFKGRLRQILRAPQREGVFVSYPVLLDAENPGGRLLPGMTATVEFIHSDARQVLRAPVEALYFVPQGYKPEVPDKLRRQLNRAGLTEQTPEILEAAEAGYLFAINLRRVFVLKNGRPEVRKVRIGAQTDEFVEVASGLQPGDLVITGRTDDSSAARPRSVRPG